MLAIVKIRISFYLLSSLSEDIKNEHDGISVVLHDAGVFDQSFLGRKDELSLEVLTALVRSSPLKISEVSFISSSGSDKIRALKSNQPELESLRVDYHIGKSSMYLEEPPRRR